jgi:hypothetical protein
MRRRSGIWLVGLVAAALGGAAVGAHASSAASTRSTGSAATLDKTFSCRVRKQHFINLGASVTLPPVQNQPQPGVVSVTTVQKTIKDKTGVVVSISQLGFSARKNSLRIDTSTCRRVKQQIPLRSKGLSGPPNVVTPTLFGHDSEQCGAAARVLIRLRLRTTAGTPTHALLAIRNANTKRRPIAFYNWSPRKFSVYIANNCRSTG